MPPTDRPDDVATLPADRAATTAARPERTRGSRRITPSEVRSVGSAESARAALSHVGDPVPLQASGAPRGFSSGRTLPVRVELARQLRRRRTQLALAFMVALPIILWIAFSLGSSSNGRNTFVDLARAGAANFTIVTIFFSSTFLLVVVVSLFFGDTIASEASWSSLRYLLAMPVPRTRLLRQKILAAAILALAALLLLTASGLVVGLIAYGTGRLSTPIGDQFDTGPGLARIALVVGYVAVQLLWVAGLAFFLSVSTDAPLGAVGGAVLLSILSQILDQISALGTLRNWLPTHYALSWTGALVQPVRWDDMVRGMFSALAYALILFAFAALRFRRKDVTS